MLAIIAPATAHPMAAPARVADEGPVCPLAVDAGFAAEAEIKGPSTWLLDDEAVLGAWFCDEAGKNDDVDTCGVSEPVVVFSCPAVAVPES